MEYYVFDTEQEAQDALDFINTSGWFPLTGNDPSNGASKPDGPKTETWCENIIERLDNKWCFPRIPSDLMDTIKVPAEQRQFFLDTFTPAIEQFDPSWFPLVED